MPLDSEVKKINQNGILALAIDVGYLTDFVDSLGVPILRENLDELQQTINLLQADNVEEFFDISTRNKKYGRVDAMNGPILLEKCVFLCKLQNHRLTYRVGLRVRCKAHQKQTSSPHYRLVLG